MMRRPYGLGAFWLLLLSTPLQAANWDLRPALLVSEIYTDNIDLVSEFDEKESEFITQVAPSFVAIYPGRRFQADINYRLQSLFYSGNRERNDTYQQLNANAETEIISDILFFDLAASQAQQIKDPEQPVTLRNVAIQNNSSDVVTANANPYLRTAFGSGGVLFLSYRQGIVDYKENSNFLVDSEMESVYFNIGERSTTRRFNWQLNYMKDEITFETQPIPLDPNAPAVGTSEEMVNIFEQQYATLIIALGAKTFWHLVSGEENNEFATQQNQENDGSYWRTGFQWANGRNDLFELWYGERFFGKTGRLKWLRVGQHMRFDMEYSEELYTDSQRQLGSTAANERANSNVLFSRASSGVYLRERLDLTLGYNRSKSIISVSLFSENRTFQSDGQSVESSGATLEWDWRMAPQTRLITRLEGRYNQFLGSEREDSLTNISFVLSRRMNPELNMNLELSHEHLHPNSGFGFGYHANSLQFGFNKAF